MGSMAKKEGNDKNMSRTFGEKIKKILKDNNCTYQVKIFPKRENLTNSAGKKVFLDYEIVVIYGGRNVEECGVGLKLVAWKNKKGEWNGDLGAVKRHGDSGSKLFSLCDYKKTLPLTLTLFSDAWEEYEKEFGGQEESLLKKMADWKLKTKTNKGGQ